MFCVKWKQFELAHSGRMRNERRRMRNLWIIDIWKAAGNVTKSRPLKSHSPRTFDNFA